MRQLGKYLPLAPSVPDGLIQHDTAPLKVPSRHRPDGFSTINGPGAPEAFKVAFTDPPDRGSYPRRLIRLNRAGATADATSLTFKDGPS